MGLPELNRIIAGDSDFTFLLICVSYIFFARKRTFLSAFWRKSIANTHLLIATSCFIGIEVGEETK